ncbi:hypothetical protein BpHYR1_024492 [Brachionus plicatilis]|uniref:Uncharacterized protein n=1 Tax=Brachionus plicatilis TaxID=10195 RepID=A0A3M7PE81_BRAPC|nr:hypothetical protein BpHYR1_024492 [Brachionus plicatilis]
MKHYKWYIERHNWADKNKQNDKSYFEKFEILSKNGSKRNLRSNRKIFKSLVPQEFRRTDPIGVGKWPIYAR